MLLAVWIRLNGGFWAYRERCRLTKNPLLRRLRRFVYTHYLEHLGSYISIDAVFAGEPRFPHKPMGVFIAPGARVGVGAVIYQQVTLGVNEMVGSRGYGSPIIGDNVFIGAGAKIIGGVRVGDDARIGAGAIVVRDVPATHVAVSPAARLLKAATGQGS